MLSKVVLDVLDQSNLAPSEYEINASLKDRTWFKVGGHADVLVRTGDLEKVRKLISLAHSNAIPLFFLGDGSNLVISDEGVEGFVIDTQALAIETPYLTEENNTTYLYAPAGILMEDLVLFSIQQQSPSLVHFFGLPGTLGGAVFMNARCYDGEIADLKPVISGLSQLGDPTSHSYHAEEWGYKVSPVQRNQMLVTHVRLEITRTQESVEDLLQRAHSFKNDRTNKGHFAFPCAGSTFKNNRQFGKPSGRIIDECNLKGLAIGGAAISSYHANIIINNNSATARDISDLVQLIQAKVSDAQGLFLEPEILFIGRGYPSNLR